MNRAMFSPNGTPPKKSWDGAPARDWASLGQRGWEHDRSVDGVLFGNLTRDGRAWENRVMSPKSHVNSQERAPRVKLAGSVLALVLLENGRQVRAKLHQLSANGGMLHLEKPLDEGILVKVLFHVGATFRVRAELLFPMWATNGYLQPFRFEEMSGEDRRRLDEQLQRLLLREV